MATTFGAQGGNNQEQNGNQQTFQQPSANPAFDNQSQDFRYSGGAYGQREPQPQRGTATIAGLMAGMGMVSTGQSSPELQAAAQQINKWLETNGNVSATNPDLRIAARVLDGATYRLPGRRSILAFAVLDLQTGVAAYTIINPLSAVEALASLPRNVQVPDNGLGNVSTTRTFQRPDSFAEQYMLSDIKMDSGEVTSVVRYVTSLVSDWLCNAYHVKNITVAQCGVLLVPMMVSVNNPQPLPESEIQLWRDALINQVATMRMHLAGFSVSRSFADLTKGESSIHVSIQPGNPDVVMSSGVAFQSNIQFVVTMGGQAQRHSAYASGDQSVEPTLLGIVHAAATLARHPDFNPNDKPHHRTNPMFVAVLTINNITTPVIFAGMADMLLAVSTHGITVEDVVTAALPLVPTASRDPGVVGYLKSFGTNGERVDVGRSVSVAELHSNMISITSGEVQVRLEYDPSNLAMAIMARPLFLATYGDNSDASRQAIYRQLGAMFGTDKLAANGFGSPGTPSGLTYTGHMTVGGETKSLASMDMIGSLTVLNDLYQADTLAQIYFGNNWASIEEPLAEQYRQLQAVAPNAVYRSISFGIRLDPQYLGKLMEAVAAAGLRVSVGGTRRDNSQMRNYDLGGGYSNNRRGGNTFNRTFG